MVPCSGLRSLECSPCLCEPPSGQSWMAQAVDLQLFRGTLCFVRAQMVWDCSDVNHAGSWGRPCIHKGYGFDRRRINSRHFAAMPDLSATWEHGPLITFLSYTCQKHSPTHQVCVGALHRAAAVRACNTPLSGAPIPTISRKTNFLWCSQNDPKNPQHIIPV
jgi:hypothetical protein